MAHQMESSSVVSSSLPPVSGEKKTLEMLLPAYTLHTQFSGVVLLEILRRSQTRAVLWHACVCVRDYVLVVQGQ